MTILDAILLGVVQGLTEFLPISSSGHLILMRDLFKVGLQSGLAFDAVLHFATACAIVVYFKDDVLKLLRASWCFIARLDQNEAVCRLQRAIIIATVPAVTFGYLLENTMATVFRDSTLVAVMLVLGALVMWAAEKWGRVRLELQGAPTYKNSFLIGLFQSLALVPGMSRSGMAISGGMLLGLSREESARFAFLLAIPLLLGAGAKKLFDLSIVGSNGETIALVVGAITAFVIGIAVIHYLLRYLRTHSLMVFVWYRLTLAVVVLFIIAR